MVTAELVTTKQGRPSKNNSPNGLFSISDAAAASGVPEKAIKSAKTMAAQPFSVSVGHAQDVTRVLPNGLTITRDPGVSLTISRETPRRSFSFSIGKNAGNPSATASASATSVSTNGAPAVAYAKASTSARVTPSGIDIARARAVAIGNASTSTSATTKP
jgi:hypothetical protein